MPQRSFSRDQHFLLPPSLDDLIPATHPLRFIALFVEDLPDTEWQALLGTVTRPHRRGAPRYAPEVLLSVWLAGFTVGIRSSRKLETACRYDLAFIWLTGNQRPDHNTLWRFYTEHRDAMRRLLKRTVQVAVAAHLVDLGLQAVDGTKVLANAAKERSLTPEELRELDARVDAEIARLEAHQAGDDDPTPPDLPGELANLETLRERITAATKQIEASGQTSKVNLTDPDARGMKTRHGLRPGYNAQAVVAALTPQPDGRRGRIVLAATVTTAADDHGQLVPMIEAAQLPDHPTPITLADGGYHSGAVLAACADANYVVAMPEARPAGESAQPYHKDQFTYDADTDCYTCPQGQSLTFRRRDDRQDGRQLLTYRAEGAICGGCPVRSACVGKQRGGKVLTVSVHDAHLRRHREWMATADAQMIARKRLGLIELVFGAIKEQHRAHRFLLRGQKAVDAEWSLLAVGYNLKTLARVWAAAVHQAGWSPQPGG
ncbi:MAG: IS1182 family transposase [Thermomicrobiales bacterium]|nr:IS1182 family transposase [Thermomicrobiales bacterium]